MLSVNLTVHFWDCKLLPNGNSSIDIIEGGAWLLPHRVNEGKNSIMNIEK